MESGMWVGGTFIMFLILVYIGVRPLLPVWHREKKRMEFPEYSRFLKMLLLKAEQHWEFFSDSLPPEVYDPITDILLGEKASLKVRVISGPKVLCQSAGENKLVDAVRSGQANNVELRTLPLEELPRNHVKIFDGKLAWIEDWHPYGRAQIYRKGYSVDDLSKVSFRRADFERHWKRAARRRPECILNDNARSLGQRA